MARGINKAILIGTLGRDPEVRHSQSGAAIANFSIATNESWKDKSTGEKQERTEWHRIVAFARLGEICGEYLRKGSQVYIEGRIQTRKWEQDGKDRYTTEIVANEMQMLGGRGAEDAPPRTQPADHAPAPPSSGNPAGKPVNTGEFDDDIPF